MSEHTPDGLGLLVVDMQSTLLAKIADQNALLKRTRLAMQAAQLFEIPIATTEQNPQKLGGIDPSLRDLSADLPSFPKQGFSAFSADGLQSWIEKLDLQHLLICGIEVPVCIYQTVLEASQYDLSVTLLLDAVGERRPTDRNAVMNAMAGSGCHILPTETVFYSLLQSAEHPLFKPFNTLIKEA